MQPNTIFTLVLCLASLAMGALGMGIRSDVEAKTYEDAGANRGDFSAGEAVPDFSSTCAFMEKARRGKTFPYGSGVLISSNLVLTAAHIVLGESNPAKIDTSAIVQFGPDLAKPTSTHKVVRVQLPPLLESIRMRRVLGGRGRAKAAEEDLASFHDVALVTIDPPATNIPAIVSTAFPERGASAWFAGYGEVGLGDKKTKRRERKPTVRYAAQNIIDRVAVEKAEEGAKAKVVPVGGSIFCDFDNGEEAYNRLNIEQPKRKLRICGAGKSDAKALDLEATCHQGDSGGPMFARIDDQWMLIGICSFGFGNGGPNHRTEFQYGEVFGYTTVPGFLNWVEQASGQAPWRR